jgi:DNA-binding LytR/AlgR family response regulator
MKYKYVVVDDEKVFRERIVAVANEFNKSESIQDYFMSTYPACGGIQLEFYAEHEGIDNNVFGNMRDADITFLDLRYSENNQGGFDLLTGLRNESQRSIIVVTSYLEQYATQANNFHQVLAWVQKPLQLDNLKDAIDKFYIKNENIAAVYREDFVEIIAKNGRKVFYNEIICAKSGGGQVRLFLKNGETLTYGANTLSITNFEKSAQLKRVSSSFLINLDLSWNIKSDQTEQLYVNSTQYELPELIEIDRRITLNFKSIIPMIANK